MCKIKFFHSISNLHINISIILFCILLLQNCISALNDQRDLLLNSEEKNALNKFKVQVGSIPIEEDFMKSDFYLIRWLRVSNLDVEKALASFVATVKWRKRNNISKILSEDWSDMEQDFPISYDGHDKEGRPILTLDVIDWDIRYAALQGKMPRLQRYLTQATERSMQSIFSAQQKGRAVTRVIVLVDVEGYNVIQHGCVACMAAMASWTVVGNSYYPLFYDEIIIINAPQAAVVALNTVRPLMSPSLRNTIKVFNSNRRAWMQYLDKRIDRSQRTRRYGGIR